MTGHLSPIAHIPHSERGAIVKFAIADESIFPEDKLEPLKASCDDILATMIESDVCEEKRDESRATQDVSQKI